MADVLFAAHGSDPPPPPIGKNWVLRFVKTQVELQIKWNRKFHSQHALCEDPVKIGAWFKLIKDTRQTYGVLNEDSYNFNETGFIMGVAGISKVVTCSDTIG